MLEGIIALVVIGTIGYFMWQKSKKSVEKAEEPQAPYKVEANTLPLVGKPADERVESVAQPAAPTLVVDGHGDVQEAKPKAKKAAAPKKPKAEKVKAEAKPKAAKKPKIKIAK